MPFLLLSKSAIFVSMSSNHEIGWKTAAGLVIANMIGTGVFTSLGFQLLEVQNSWSIILLWTLGGAMALIGALIYAELGTHFQKSGGDYIFLSETLHPSIGYLYAWVSLTVGFSAPIAIAAMAMNNYLTPILGESIWPGLIFLIGIPIGHIVSLRQSSLIQNSFTLLKISFVLILIGIGFYYAPQIELPALDFSSNWSNEITKPGFAVSLIFVFYAFTGWNSAAYIVEEIDQPRKNLPKALISSTIFVTVVYILLQLIFLKHASVDQLSGKVQIATIAFANLFGPTGAAWISFFIAIQLIATISGYSWIGPRITHSIAKDYKLWKPVATVNSNGIPVPAIILNTTISLILFLSGSFEQILIYAGFVLQLMGTITIFSSLRIKKRAGFKSPWKPFLQITYITLSLGIMGYILWDKPMESLIGLGLVTIGLLLYLIDSPKSKIPAN
jgi:APA family basic amino acid/polyamine antiporter